VLSGRKIVNDDLERMEKESTVAYIMILSRVGGYAPWLQVLLITLNYNAIADLHNVQFTVTHAVGFSVFTSRILATDLNTETSTSNHYEVFLLFHFQSLWNL
jgi:hypothetical protein